MSDSKGTLVQPGAGNGGKGKGRYTIHLQERI